MGRQGGILQIKGEVGGMSSHKTSDRYFCAEERDVDKDSIMNDPVVRRTRENSHEFGKAGQPAHCCATGWVRRPKKGRAEFQETGQWNIHFIIGFNSIVRINTRFIEKFIHRDKAH